MLDSQWRILQKSVGKKGKYSRLHKINTRVLLGGKTGQSCVKPKVVHTFVISDSQEKCSSRQVQISWILNNIFCGKMKHLPFKWSSNSGRSLGSREASTETWGKKWQVLKHCRYTNETRVLEREKSDSGLCQTRVWRGIQTNSSCFPKNN